MMGHRIPRQMHGGAPRRVYFDTPSLKGRAVNPCGFTGMEQRKQ